MIKKKTEIQSNVQSREQYYDQECSEYRIIRRDPQPDEQTGFALSFTRQEFFCNKICNSTKMNINVYAEMAHENEN